MSRRFPRLRPLSGRPGSHALVVGGGTITKDGKTPPRRERRRTSLQLRRAQKRAPEHLARARSRPNSATARKRNSSRCSPGTATLQESLHHYSGKAALKKIEEADASQLVGGGDTFLLLRTLYGDPVGSPPLRERVLAGAAFNGSSAGCNIAGLNIGCTNDFSWSSTCRAGRRSGFPCVFNPDYPNRRRNPNTPRG